MTTYPQPEQLNEIPPIVLLVGTDQDAREMFTVLLESSGFWVASAAEPDTALPSVAELRPNLILTDLGAGADGSARALEFVHTVKTDEAAHGIPVLLLSARTADELPDTCEEADALLLKPVMPEVLLSRIRELIAKSRDLRERADAAREKGHRLTERSMRLLERSAANAESVDLRNRRCPGCRRRLEWMERATVGGTEYDYYRWCTHGCGLYCFDRRNGAWLKLA
jgi:DNA-binding response OmpR family regulator